MDTKKLRQKILDLAIRGKLVPQDPNDEPASVLLERIRAEKERLIKEGKIKRSKKSASTDKSHYENPPFEIPESWCWTTLENICSKIGSGSTPKGGIYSTEGILFFRSQNVYNNGVVLEDIKYISEEVHQSMIGTEVLPNDLLLNITGGSLGRCAIVPYYIDRGNVSQHVCIIRPIIVKAEYLHLFILSSFFTRTMKITGSGREGLPKYNLENMLLPLPSLSEQARIVDEVAKWNKIIDEIEDDKLELESYVKQIKSKILDLAISGKLVPQVPNDEPAIELLRRINPAFQPCDNSHYENVPEGWTICKISDLCKIENGFAFSSDDYKTSGIPLIRISNITNNTIDLSDCVYIENIEINDKYIISKGDLLIAMSGATTGKMGVYKNNNISFLNQRVCNVKIIDNSVLVHSYRNYFLQSKVSEILTLAYGGAQPNISTTMIGNFEILLPPYNEQERIVSTIEFIFTQINTITAEL